MVYITGIDIGTTSTKAVAFTDRGEVLAEAARSYQAVTDGEGRHELDPEILFEALMAVASEVIGAAGLEGLKGISLSCAMHSLIAVDGEGGLLTNAITWADLRSKSYAEALKKSEAGRGIYRQTGTPLHPMSPLSKLLWLKEAEPALFARAARFISIKEYVWWKLFGVYHVDYSIASATGLFDIYGFEWYGGSLEQAGIGPERLSEPVPCTHVSRGLGAAHAAALGLPGGMAAGLPWVIGGSDGCLANLGSGALQPGETALTIGTSGAIRMTAAAPEHDPGERIFNYVLTKDFYISGGATNNGGVVLQWYRDQFLEAGMEIGSMIGEAGRVAAGSEGLVCLPYIRGERAPIWDADARAVFFGIRPVHGRAHFVRAILEGICFSLYQIGKVLEERIGPVRHIIASGGFTRNPVWLQMMADVFMKEVYTTDGADASAVGAAMMGFYALGEIKDLGDAAGLVRKKDVYRPDAGQHAVYLSRYVEFAELYLRLKDLM